MRPDILESIKSVVARTAYFKELAFKHRMPDMFQEAIPMSEELAGPILNHNRGREIWFGTSVRKKGDDGKWYLIAVVEVFYLADESSIIGALSNAFRRFFLKVFETSIFFRMEGADKLQDVDGNPVTRLDPDQTDQIPLYQQLLQNRDEKGQ